MPRRRAEIGSPGLPIFSGLITMDPNKKLRGREAIRIFREMAYDEPAASAFLGACRNLLRTDYQVVPGGTSEGDKQAAAFVEECLDDMRESAQTQTRQLYSMLWAGYAYHELVWKRREDGRVGWGAWAIRRQESFDRWQYDTRKNVITGWTQRPAPTFELRTIPIQKAIHVVSDDAEGSPEGMSLLRPMYRQWYFCKNVELLMGISLERFGTGIPVFSQAEGNTVQLDKDSDAFTLLEDMAASLRQNEEAYVIEPWGWRFRFEPSPGLDTKTFLEAIMRYRLYMLQTALADFIMLGSDSGSFALGKDKSDLFLLALNGIQERMVDALNRQAVDRLMRYNAGAFGALENPPKLTLPAIRKYDLEQLGGFAEILHRIGAFHVTPEDEALFRKISDLADAKPEDLEPLFKQDKADAAKARAKEASAARPMDDDEMMDETPADTSEEPDLDDDETDDER